MIKVNLLKDQAVPAKDPIITTPKMSRIGLVYIAAVVVVTALLGFWWYDSGKSIEAARTTRAKLENDLRAIDSKREQFAELEKKKQERQGKINVIERLQESQKGPVKLLNVIIQAVPQNREIWLTSLEQTGNGIKVLGTTRSPEVLPDFMNSLTKSGIFTSVDIELVERRDDVSNFSIICTGK